MVNIEAVDCARRPMLLGCSSLKEGWNQMRLTWLKFRLLNEFDYSRLGSLS